ncbi:hypothetical protein J7E97_13855 [Streptomyces sp. ISL-66]|uniref:hypothetical protein n=1 Tax=Streptomyces sp. ISL-66 TaxID=2819186 RepID=UPI001BEC6C59|nr:hypothetical protein [Streptomyces sp. ISL-66]MBT2468928.1 hypothetical protein [Streptomyces sp. ISL-66]
MSPRDALTTQTRGHPSSATIRVSRNAKTKAVKVHQACACRIGKGLMLETRDERGDRCR